MQFRLQLKVLPTGLPGWEMATVYSRTIEQVLPVMPAYAAIR
jgi:hypothetical protein